MTPKDFIGERATYDNYGQFIWAVSAEGGHQKLADLRGWGAIQNLFKTKEGLIDEAKAGAFQDELGQWIVDAINEKGADNDTQSTRNTKALGLPASLKRDHRIYDLLPFIMQAASVQGD